MVWLAAQCQGNRGGDAARETEFKDPYHLRALLQARGIGGRTDHRWRRTQRVISAALIGLSWMPVWPMLRTVVLETNNLPPAVRSSEMPRAAPPKLPSTMVLPPMILIPISPALTPLSLRLRRRTRFFACPAR